MILKAYPLKGILEHPELEQYYPDLADKIKVKFYESQDKKEGASVQNHSDGTYTIRINKKFREENGSVRVAAMETLRHETQHVIQGLERSIKGGRIADVGGTQRKHLYQLLKRGKLKIYRESSKPKIKVKFYESQDKNEGASVQNHSDGTYTIRINKDFREANNWKHIPLTLSHEIQHVIQGLERSIKGSRIADVGGTQRKHLYQLLKRGKLKIYRESSKPKIKVKFYESQDKNEGGLNTKK